MVGSCCRIIRSIQLKPSLSTVKFKSNSTNFKIYSVNERSFSKKATFDIAGIYPPIITTFDEKSNINYDGLLQNMKRWETIPFKGYVVLGSTGEFPVLREDEKVNLVKCVKEASNPEKLVVVGSGSNSTKATIDLTNRMAEVGADAALVISPYFYKGRMTDDAFYDHYIKVADSSKIPIILYSVPANTGIDLNASLVAKLADHPNIIGMKDSGGDIQKIAWIVHKTKGKNFQVLAGSAGFLYPSLCVGCVGAVAALANPLGGPTCQVYEYFVSGKHDEAREMQHRIIGPNLAVTKMFGIPGVKAAMDMMGYIGGPCHPPLKSLNTQEVSKVRDEFKNNGFL